MPSLGELCKLPGGCLHETWDLCHLPLLSAHRSRPNCGKMPYWRCWQGCWRAWMWPPRTLKKRASWRRSGQRWGDWPSSRSGTARPPVKTSSGKPSPPASATLPGPAGLPAHLWTPVPSPELPSFTPAPLRIKHGASGTRVCLSAPCWGWGGHRRRPPFWEVAVWGGGHFERGLHSHEGAQGGCVGPRLFLSPVLKAPTAPSSSSEGPGACVQPCCGGVRPRKWLCPGCAWAAAVWDMTEPFGGVPSQEKVPERVV